MAQASSRDTARNNGKQTGEVAAEAIDQTADHAHATTETLAAATEAALDRGREAVDRAAPMVRLVLDEAGPAMRDLVRAETDLAALWIELTREQMQRNVQTMQRLAATRDWREALEIQHDFVHQSMARLGEGMTRQMEMAGDMTSRWLSARQDGLKKAA